MKLIVKQLKTFNSIAGGMKVNNILPITSYLKFEDGYITKNNMESFVTMEADFKGKCLIDEKALMSIVEKTNEEYIEVKVKDKTVTLLYGDKKGGSPTDDLINFPKNDESDAKEIEISSEVIKAIKVASNFTIDNGHLPFTACVFIGNGIVSASTGFIAYAEKEESKLPEIILDKSAVSAIRNFDSVSYSENESYQFFTNHIFRFGFSKKDTKFVNMKPFSIVPPDLEKIEINKNEILNFCEICISSCPSRAIVATAKGKKLHMVDAAYEINHDHPISVELPDFSFNPVFMAKLLKSIPDEKINIYKGPQRYYITGESGFVSLIMEMQPQTN